MDFTALLAMLSQPQQAQPPIIPPGAMGSALFNPPQGDPYEALNAVLNNLSRQPLVQQPPQSALDMILEGIGQAAAVGASRDPGAALGQQIETKQQNRKALQDQEIARQNFINQVKVQAGIQQATNLSTEQAKVREENRAFQRGVVGSGLEEARDIRKEKRTFKTAIDLKEADLKFAERERENALFFENRNEAMINILRRNKTFIDMLPEQNKEKVKMMSIWQSIAPNEDPTTLGAIADKMSGMSRIGLTPNEKQVLNRVNVEIGRREKELFEAQVENIKAQAEYARGGKQGSLESLLKRTTITNTANEIIKGIGDVYVETTPGVWKAEKNLTEMERMQLRKARRSTPEETKAETDRRIKAVQDALQQQELERQQEEEQNSINQLAPLVKPTPKTKQDTSEVKRAQDIVKQSEAKQRTKEQIIIILKANNISPEVIKQVTGVDLNAPKTPTQKSQEEQEVKKKRDEMFKEIEQKGGRFY